MLGRWAGRVMAKRDEDDRWIVDLLAPRPDDRILDVGCGPGVSLALIAERVTDGVVCGIDPSPTMLRQAGERISNLGQTGAVQLREGSAEAIPYPDGQFTGVCSLHTMYFWSSVEAGLRETYRVLRPGGRLAIAVRTRREGVGVLSPSRYGYTDAQLDEVLQTMRSLGFHDADSARREIGYEIVVGITARK
jgi:ubiquinone/menaquinone biosynthesis C-methylase UbiE